MWEETTVTQVLKIEAPGSDELLRSLASSSRLASRSAKLPSAESSSLMDQKQQARCLDGRLRGELSETLRKLRSEAQDLKRDRALLAEHVASLAAQAAQRPTLNGTGRSLKTLSFTSTTATQTASKAAQGAPSVRRRSSNLLTRSLKRTTFTSTSKWPQH